MELAEFLVTVSSQQHNLPSLLPTPQQLEALITGSSLRFVCAYVCVPVSLPVCISSSSTGHAGFGLGWLHSSAQIHAVHNPLCLR